MKLSKVQLKALEAVEGESLSYSCGLIETCIYTEEGKNTALVDVIEGLKSLGLVSFENQQPGMVQSTYECQLTPAGRKALGEARNGK